MKCKIGVIGLGIMGRNLALNLERNGLTVAAFDLEKSRTKAFFDGPAKGRSIRGSDSARAFVAALERPRNVWIMVPAGSPVDGVIAHLKQHLEPADILIDGGNSFFTDTERRNKALETDGLLFIGTGVSGGESGALWGASLMPGGQREAWKALEPIFKAIAAKAEDGQPCVEYMGPRGAGHYVMMVHNGIEYADMQLIAEIYDLLSRGLGLTAQELQAVFAEWNQGVLKSYLIEITANIFGKRDPESGRPVIELILDEALQKGTGKWTSQNAMDVGAPVPTINAAVESRMISALKPQRLRASKILRGPKETFSGGRQRLIDAARDALYASKIVSYAQGMSLLGMASDEYTYDFRLLEIAKVWRAGCIIRASLLGEIMKAFEREPQLSNLLLDGAFRDAVESRQAGWRYTLQTAIGLGIPALALSTALAYFDSFRSQRLPANLIQAQPDYFGAHTYRRIDKQGVFHTEWG